MSASDSEIEEMAEEFPKANQKIRQNTQQPSSDYTQSDTTVQGSQNTGFSLNCIHILFILLLIILFFHFIRK